MRKKSHPASMQVDLWPSYKLILCRKGVPLRLIRKFRGCRIAFPLEGETVEGTLRQVDRTGYIWVEDVVTGKTELGEMILELPAWVRVLDE